MAVRPDKREEFLQAVDSLGTLEREQEWCVSQCIYVEQGEDNRFLWVERWTDRRYLEDRLRSQRFRALLGAVRVLGSVSDVQVVESASWTEGARDPHDHANTRGRS